MALILSENQKRDYKPIDEGTYMAICCGLVDIGDHYSEQYDKVQRKVLIIWELSGAGTVTINDMEVNRTMSNRYTMSFSNKSTLRKDLRSWRGREFTDEELRRFDLKNILSVPCQLQVIHTNSNGNTYANIAGIMSLPKGMPKPEQTNTTMYWDFEENEIGDSQYSMLPEWVRNIIENSETYNFITTGDPCHLTENRRNEVSEYQSFKAYRAANGDFPLSDDDDDCPF